MWFALPALVLTASLARASSSPAQLPHLVSLFSRQLDGFSPSSVPAGCQTICAPILSTINTCSDLACVCNNPTAQQVATCADCFASASGSSLQSVQDLIDQYINACNTSGDPVSSIQVSSVSASAGGSTDTASSTGSPAASSTSTSTGTATAASSSTSSSSAAARNINVYTGQGVLACGVAALLAVAVL